MHALVLFQLYKHLFMWMNLYDWEIVNSLNVYNSFLQGRSHIFKIHARSMSVEKDIRYELLARLCPNSTGQ